MTKKELYLFLEENHERYNRPDFIVADPICVPHRFSKKEDIEIAGFLTATLAWGRRPTIIKNALELIKRMDNAPHDFILHHASKDRLQFQRFKHRTFNGVDCVFFLKSLQHIYKKHAGLENVFSVPSFPTVDSVDSERPIIAYYPAGKESETKLAISNFRKVFFSIPHPSRTQKHVSNPEANSAAKRLNMFLRWMIRNDARGVDFGIWKNFKVNRLLCPLDIHSGNVARKLGLLKRKQNDWQSVEELTDRLREFDANDPVKYDFALFGLGAEPGKSSLSREDLNINPY